MENKNSSRDLIKSFRAAVAGVNKLVGALKERVYELNDDINKQVNIIEDAYNVIKLDRSEIAEIYGATQSVVDDVSEVQEEAQATLEDSAVVIDDMYPLVEDRYITDRDYILIEESGDEVAKDEEETDDYISPEVNSEECA